jgi:hypothetical protein
MSSGNSVTRALLVHVQENLKQGNINKAKSYGFSDEELRLVSNLSSSQIDSISSSGLSVVRLEIDHPNLKSLIGRVEEDEGREQLVDKMLFLGASGSMMNDFFGMSTSEVATRRILLGITSKRGRRPALYNNAEYEGDMYQRWIKVSKNKKDKYDTEALICLSEEFKKDLSEVWGLVKTWCD